MANAYLQPPDRHHGNLAAADVREIVAAVTPLLAR
jgi:hypothetical protein